MRTDDNTFFLFIAQISPVIAPKHHMTRHLLTCFDGNYYSSYILLQLMTSKIQHDQPMSVSIHIPAQAYNDLSLKSRQASHAWTEWCSLVAI